MFGRLVAVIGCSCLLGGCLSFASRTPAPEPVRPAPQPAAVAASSAAIPSAVLAAAPGKVRSVIAQRAMSRGTQVLVNDDRGVILQRPIAETTERLAQLCGPHQAGRTVQIILTTTPSGAGTLVTERRFIVDGEKICAVPLTAPEVDQALQNMRDIEAQARA